MRGQEKWGHLILSLPMTTFVCANRKTQNNYSQLRYPTINLLSIRSSQHPAASHNPNRSRQCSTNFHIYSALLQRPSPARDVQSPLPQRLRPAT